MLSAAAFQKCKESKKMEIERQDKIKKEELIKVQLSNIDKQLSKAYEEINNELKLDINYITVKDDLLPKTIDKVQELGYYIQKINNEYKICFEEPKQDKDLNKIHILYRDSELDKELDRLLKDSFKEYF